MKALYTLIVGLSVFLCNAMIPPESAQEPDDVVMLAKSIIKKSSEDLITAQALNQETFSHFEIIQNSINELDFKTIDEQRLISWLIDSLLPAQLKSIEITYTIGQSLDAALKAKGLIDQYAQEAKASGSTDQFKKITKQATKLQTNTFQLASLMQSAQLVAENVIALVITTIMQVPRAMQNNIIAAILKVEHTIAQLLNKNLIGAVRDSTLDVQAMARLLTDTTQSQRDRVTQAEQLAQGIIARLPVEPQLPTPLQPIPSAPTPTQPPLPMPTPPAPKPPIAAPGKAQENIIKANGKLNSALRRLDAIRGYYKEMDKEEKSLVKKKAENILRQSDITQFANSINHVKQEAGAQLDQTKLAPFNNFVDLINRLSDSIKRLG